jgi:LmbE family N-acetylglucosaminyl deacetylase
VLAAAPVWAQRDLSGADEIKLSLDRLQTIGSLLMIGAHPDDENTAVIAYFARGRKIETAYLSLTRGEGGQNLIGPEQGDKLGVIRTEELLAARRIDGGRQFFTRAIDFGFTKTAQETMEKWGHDRILGDVVWIIRKFRPDVIVLRFSGTPRDGHGQHQASAILGKEAFFAAADPKRFPEQLKYVQTWQAKRLLWNVFSFTREQQRELEKQNIKIQVDTGDYDPLLGYSFGEIAGMSRSMHRSQGMGAPERKGSMPQFFQVVAGEPASHDPFDGIDTSWRRMPDGEAVEQLLSKAAHDFQPEHPDKLIPALLQARPLIAAMKAAAAQEKLKELDNTVALCAGLWLDAAADRPDAIPGSSVKLTVTALNRSSSKVSLQDVKWAGAAVERPAEITGSVSLPPNEPVTKEVQWSVPAREPYTQPYWLQLPKQGDTYAVADQRLIGRPEKAPVLVAQFTLLVDGSPIVVERPVINR